MFHHICLSENILRLSSKERYFVIVSINLSLLNIFPTKNILLKFFLSTKYLSFNSLYFTLRLSNSFSIEIIISFFSFISLSYFDCNSVHFCSKFAFVDFNAVIFFTFFTIIFITFITITFEWFIEMFRIFFTS